MSEELNEYDRQAAIFLRRFGVEVRMVHAQERAPDWGDAPHSSEAQHWRVTVVRTSDKRRRLSFDFWNSVHDTERGIDLRPYGVLACLSSDAGMDEDPDEIAREFGPMAPSKAYAVADFGRKIRKFFAGLPQVEALCPTCGGPLETSIADETRGEQAHCPSCDEDVTIDALEALQEIR